MKKLIVLDEYERNKILDYYEKSCFIEIKKGLSNKEFLDKIADYSKENGFKIEPISNISNKPLNLSTSEKSYLTINKDENPIYHLLQIKEYGLSGPDYSSTHERSILTNHECLPIAICSLDEVVEEYTGGGMPYCSRGAKSIINLVDPFIKYVYPSILSSEENYGNYK